MRGLRFKTGLGVITALSSGLFSVIDSAKGATGCYEFDSPDCNLVTTISQRSN